MNVKYYKNGNGVIATIGNLDLPEISYEAFEAGMQEAEKRIKVQEAVYEKRKPLTESEVLAMLIPRQINTLAVDDNTALRMLGFYPAFEDVIGQTVKQGFRFTCGGRLWKTEQEELTIQVHYAPGEGTESLYSEVCETHTGTIDDPIPYDGNMTLEAGKHYMQDWMIFRCIRDTMNPVHHDLADLAGVYVEKV